ncbi:MAG TPA: beta/gamma crystallin-related protein [Steroidobacteraceae bacterium]|nr:beta/gamma crystallin-related protein [Steroidobacteraceae bacterium]
MSKSKISALAICAVASVSGAADLTLYTDGEFQGRPLNVIIDMKQLGSMNFNDRASSVVIEKGAWVLCTDEDFSGKCVTLEPGKYGSLRDMGLDDTITSVRRRDAMSPGVFSDAQATTREN